GDHAVAVRTVGRLVESDRAMPREAVEFDERAGVEQRVDSFARGSLALRVLAFDGCRRPGVHGLGVAAEQVGELARGGMRVGLVDAHAVLLGCPNKGWSFSGDS